MATMNVSLPDPMKQWVEAQARSGRYSNASDYVRDLIRRDQDRAAEIESIRAALMSAENSGFSDSGMEKIRAEVQAELRGDGRL